MDYEGLLELVKKRRSVRRFKPAPVPDEYVEKIIEAARWAPSGANSQPWEFIVIKEQETKDRIADLANEHGEHLRRMEATREERLRHPASRASGGRHGFQDAPVLIIVCGDPRTKETYPLSVVYSHGDSNFSSSLANAFLYMHLAAASMGLGSQWITSTAQPFVEALLKEFLDIPRELKIYDTMAVGYPAYNPGPRLVRGMDEMIHHERYDRAKFRTGEGIRDFIVSVHKNRGGAPR
ncbi:nitroreductase family protein [Chloroflexota bacterium]